MSDLAMITANGDFEVCADYRVSIEHDDPVCAGCGHLADDHDGGRAATVTALRRRRHPAGSARPTRKAS